MIQRVLQVNFVKNKIFNNYQIINMVQFTEWYIKNIPKPYEKILNELEKLK